MSDCVVVGAGPSGLMLALLLARSGRPVRVLERQPDLGPPPGGVVLQPATLGLFRRLGRLDDLSRAGTKLMGVDEVGPAGPLFSGDYADLPGTPCPWALALPLRVVREVLLGLVGAETAVTIRTGTEVVALRPGDDGCEVVARTDGEESVLRARYVVGADGKHSTVRKAAGLAAEVVPFEGRQLIARMPRPEAWPARVRSHRDDASIVLIPSGPEALHVFGAVETDDRAKALAQLGEGLARYDEPLAQVLREAGETVAVVRHHTVHAPRWHTGRVVLLGDSAHSMHPYGGQGMNLGLQDAALLAGLVRDDSLEDYERIRRPFVERFQRRQHELLDTHAPDEPAPDAQTLYRNEFADLALGQPELRPLFES